MFKNQNFLCENIIHFINIKNKNNLIRIRKIFIKNKYINPIIIFPEFDFRIDNYIYNIFDTFFSKYSNNNIFTLANINTTFIEIDKDNNKKKFYNNLNIINASKNNRNKKTNISRNNNNIEKKIQNNKTNSKNNSKEKDNDNPNDNIDPPNNNSKNENQNNNGNYINNRFIMNIKNKLDISENEVIQIDVFPDGNCLMRAISLFYYKNENLYNHVRKEIVDYLFQHKNDYIDIELETEDGLMNIDDYIDYIKRDGIWGGELEKYAAQELYNINIADYIEIKNSLTLQKFHKFIYNLNQDNIYEKDLCILTLINQNHYNLIYDKIYKCYKNKNNKLIFFGNLDNINLIKNNQPNFMKINNNNKIIEKENHSVDNIPEKREYKIQLF